MVRCDDGVKGQPYAELAKHDGDGAGVSAALQHRDGKLTAHQEAGFLAIRRDEVWLGQDFEQTAALQRLDERGQIQVRPESKDRERIGNRELVCTTTDLSRGRGGKLS